MAGSLPNLKHIDLFTKIYGLISTRDVTLSTVSRELMKSPSTVSECISELELYYRKSFVETARGAAKPTPQAKEAVEKFERILRLARSLNESDAPAAVEIRIASTLSLRHRLFRGPVAALMWWLQGRKPGGHTGVRVVVDAFDHSSLARRVAERGVGAYHWGVCWELPGKRDHTYLDFTDIPLDGNRGGCATPVVALTSHLEYGGQPAELKVLFRPHRPLETRALMAHVPGSRLAILHSEPEDELRRELVAAHNADTALRVHQYEEALHHVQSTDADLAVVPGWYRFRHHTEWVGLCRDGVPVTRRVQIVLRKPDGGARQEPDAPTNWPEPVRAFYVISRLFLSDPTFAPAVFGTEDGIGRGEPGKKRGRPAGTGHDPMHDTVYPEAIAQWVTRNTDRIARAIQDTV